MSEEQLESVGKYLRQAMVELCDAEANVIKMAKVQGTEPESHELYKPIHAALTLTERILGGLKI